MERGPTIQRRPTGPYSRHRKPKAPVHDGPAVRSRPPTPKSDLRWLVSLATKATGMAIPAPDPTLSSTHGRGTAGRPPGAARLPVEHRTGQGTGDAVHLQTIEGALGRRADLTEPLGQGPITDGKDVDDERAGLLHSFPEGGGRVDQAEQACRLTPRRLGPKRPSGRPCPAGDRQSRRCPVPPAARATGGPGRGARAGRRRAAAFRCGSVPARRPCQHCAAPSLHVPTSAPSRA
jgi:hypothetical protein